jgi:hypothetical protein
MPKSCAGGSSTATSRGAGGHDPSGDMNSTSGCGSSSHRPMRSWRPTTRSSPRVPECPRSLAERLLGGPGQVALPLPSATERRSGRCSCSTSTGRHSVGPGGRCARSPPRQPARRLRTAISGRGRTAATPAHGPSCRGGASIPTLCGLGPPPPALGSARTAGEGPRRLGTDLRI